MYIHGMVLYVCSPVIHPSSLTVICMLVSGNSGRVRPFQPPPPLSLNDSWSLETSAEWHLVFSPPSLAVASRRAAATSSAAPSPRTTSNMAASVREKQTGSFNCFFFIKACFQRRTAAGTGCREFKRPSVCRRRFIQNCHPDKQLTNRSLSRVAAAGADD